MWAMFAPAGVQLVDRLVAGELGGGALSARLRRPLLPEEGRQFRRGWVGARRRLGSSEGTGGIAQRGALVQQVPAVDDLLGGGRAACRRVGVEPAAIPRDRRDLRVLLQPGGDLVGVAVGQQIEGPPLLQINDDGAEAATATPGELVHAHGAGLPDGGQRRRADQAEERRPAGGQPEGDRQAGTGRPAERQADPLERVAQPVGPPRVTVHELRQLLGEDTLRVGGNLAEESAHPQPEPDRRPAPGEVSDRAVIATVDPPRAAPTRGARCGPARGVEAEGDPPLVAVISARRSPLRWGRNGRRRIRLLQTAATIAKQKA